jgi:hypothetical protein
MAFAEFWEHILEKILGFQNTVLMVHFVRNNMPCIIYICKWNCKFILTRQWQCKNLFASEWNLFAAHAFVSLT